MYKMNIKLSTIHFTNFKLRPRTIPTTKRSEQPEQNKLGALMKLFITTLVLLSGLTQARADGWVCATEDESLRVRVYNHVQPELGTRTAAVMVFSDPRVGAGRKTIARFTAGNTLSNLGSSYEANVDLRFADSSAKGELIAGTKLGFIDTITMDVDFNYSRPVAAGELTQGDLTVVKRNGRITQLEVSCERYLKN